MHSDHRSVEKSIYLPIYYHKSMVGARDKHLLADLLPERSDCVHTVQVSQLNVEGG